MRPRHRFRLETGVCGKLNEQLFVGDQIVEHRAQERRVRGRGPEVIGAQAGYAEEPAQPVGIGGNLLVFAALGFFAPMRFAALASVPRILALGAGCSVLVETAQYVFRLDRVSSVDDVLVNAAGAVLAGLASRHWWRTTAEVPSDQPHPAPTAAD